MLISNDKKRFGILSCCIGLFFSGVVLLQTDGLNAATDDRGSIILGPGTQDITGYTGIRTDCFLWAFNSAPMTNLYVGLSYQITSGQGVVNGPTSLYVGAHYTVDFEVEVTAELSMNPGETLIVEIVGRCEGNVSTAIINFHIAAHPCSMQLDQPLAAGTPVGFDSTESPWMPGFGVYLADDFTFEQTQYIERIYIPGNIVGDITDLMDVESLTWMIFADADGKPDGDPDGGGNPPVRSGSLLPSDPQIYIATGIGGNHADIMFTPETPIVLEPGHYWMVCYATMMFYQYAHYQRYESGTSHGNICHVVNPGGAWGFGQDWQPWSVLGATQVDMAFEMCGGIGIPTPAPPTPTPSNTPAPSHSPDLPSATPVHPTYTPLCSTTGVTLTMPSHFYEPGVSCSLQATVCNSSGIPLTGYPLVIVLEILSNYYFGPDFNTLYTNYLEDYPDYSSGMTLISIIPEFSWPAGAGSFSNAVFYGALLNPEQTQLYGTMDSWIFGWAE